MISYAETARRAIDLLATRALSLAAVLVFALWFANFPIYAGLYLVPSVTPLHWIALTVLLIGGLAYLQDSWKVHLSSSIILWWFGALLLNVIWFIAKGGGNTVILTSRAAGLVFFAATYFALASSPQFRLAVIRALLAVVLLAVLLNAYNLVSPFAFVPAESEFAIVGRAAGIYINPNTSGAAIVLGMLIASATLQPRFRALFVFICAVGVAMTISRGAIVILVFAIVVLASTGVLSRRSILLVIGVLSTITALLAIFLWPVVSDVLGGIDGIERLLLVLNPSGQADFSQDERLYLAEHGWDQFVADPLVGNGIGSTETWVYRSSTHNQYLQFMSDFGVLGVLVVPMLAVALLVGRTMRDWLPIAVSGCVILWSFLSHNVLTEYFWLLAIAIAASSPSVEKHAVAPTTIRTA